MMNKFMFLMFILLFTSYAFAIEDSSHRQSNSPDKPVIISVDSSGRRVENSPDRGNFSEKKPEILEEKSPEKISDRSVTEEEKFPEKKPEILEEKSPEKISDRSVTEEEKFPEKKPEILEEKSPEKISDRSVTEEQKPPEKISDISDRRLKNSDDGEIKNQDINNYNTYNTYNVTPDMPGYWDTRGDNFFSDRRYAEALECYVKALKINPSSKELDDKIAEAKILFDNLDVYFKNSEGTTLLHSRVNNFSDVKALVYNGADINAANIYGDTPLLSLAGSGDYNPDRLDTARFLIEHGASVNAQDREGNTPLHKAAGNGFYGLVDLLIKKGAIIDMRNFYGYTPLDMAMIWGREDTVRLLQKYGAK